MAVNPIREFNEGKFVISLDFELFWGVRDKKTIEAYGPNILGVREAIPAMLNLFDRYGIKATFSTVGFLFAEDRNELMSYIPAVRPEYDDKKLSPYPDIDTIGINEEDDPYHFGFSLLKMIKQKEIHEIGTHTFCHYYCLEPGQNIDSFRHDLKAAKKIAEKKNIKVRSLVFPRNQFSEDYLVACKESGIDSYRGNPVSWLYEARNKNDESLLRRLFRFIDTYINLTGYHCHSAGHVFTEPVVNVAASRFLRPYNKKLAFLDFLRMKRISAAMQYAAKHKKLFHLWWHPHNFGVNLQENIRFLEKILTFYRKLNEQYGFSSITMTELADERRKK